MVSERNNVERRERERRAVEQSGGDLLRRGKTVANCYGGETLTNFAVVGATWVASGRI